MNFIEIDALDHEGKPIKALVQPGQESLARAVLASELKPQDDEYFVHVSKMADGSKRVALLTGDSVPEVRMPRPATLALRAVSTTIRELRDRASDGMLEVWPANMAHIEAGFEGRLSVVDARGIVHRLELLEAYVDHFVCKPHSAVAVGSRLIGAPPKLTSLGIGREKPLPPELQAAIDGDYEPLRKVIRGVNRVDEIVG